MFVCDVEHRHYVLYDTQDDEMAVDWEGVYTVSWRYHLTLTVVPCNRYTYSAMLA